MKIEERMEKYIGEKTMFDIGNYKEDDLPLWKVTRIWYINAKNKDIAIKETRRTGHDGVTAVKA